jgi:hypothetical protein
MGQPLERILNPLRPACQLEGVQDGHLLRGVPPVTPDQLAAVAQLPAKAVPVRLRRPPPVLLRTFRVDEALCALGRDRDLRDGVVTTSGSRLAATSVPRRTGAIAL